MRTTEDHPYYTQLLCHILWDRRREKNIVTKEDIPEAVSEVFLREAHAFCDLWDMLPRKARQLLVALAKEEGPQCQIFSNDFLRRHNLGPASSVQRAVAGLLREEVLEKADDRYRYTDIFFKRWLKKTFV